MSEQQLRDILARVVPEPPDGVTDPAPVVRAARRQRRVQTVAVSGVAALTVVGIAVGVQNLQRDDGPEVVNEPAQILDPYSTAPCPPADQPWPDGAIDDLDQVVAVRECPRPNLEGFTLEGSPDALVVGLEAFAEGVRELPLADPELCAAEQESPLDSDGRLLLQLDDGSTLTVEYGQCAAQAEGRAVMGLDVDRLFFEGLRAQRAAHEYAANDVSAPADCNSAGRTPALPGVERLVAATACTDQAQNPVELDLDAVDRLDAAWRDAEAGMCGDDLAEDPLSGSALVVLAITDRGDLVRLIDEGCEALTVNTTFAEEDKYLMDITLDDLIG